MAVETSYIIRASAKGFTEAGRAIKELNKEIKQAGEDGKKMPGGNLLPGRGPKGLGPAAPYVPSPRSIPNIPGRPGVYAPNAPGGGMLPGRPGFVPGYTPGLGPARPAPGSVGPAPGTPPPMPNIPSPGDKGVGPATPDPTSTGGGDGGGGGGGGGGLGKRPSIKMLGRMAAAYNALATAAELAARQMEHANTRVAAGMGNFRELAGLFRGRASGAGGGGGGGGTGGGGGPRPPPIPRAPSDPGPTPPKKTLSNRFIQGFLEGLIPGIGQIDKGNRKAMLQQFGGRFVAGAGRSLADFAYSGLQAPFRGVSGVQSFIGKTPIIGSSLADATGQAFANAGTAIGFEGQQQAALPYLGRTGVRANNLRNRGMPGLFSFDQLAALGMRKGGMGAAQSQQYLTSLAQASGSTADNPLVGGALSSSMSAFGRYGIGPDIAGTFVQGQRQQGASNNVGINGLIRSLATGRQGLGLEGTELQDYMRQMAEDIASFKTTGIPLATESIGALSMSFNAAGITGSRSAMLAGNFQKNAQNIGMNGPNSVEDYALLQAAAGRPLNGIDDSLDVMDKLQSGLSPGESQKTFRNVLRFAQGRYGNDKKGQFQQRQFLGRMGLNFNSKEFRALSTSKDPTLSDDQVATFNAGLNREALGNVSSVVQNQAGLDNSNLSLGMQGLETYFKSEQFHKDLSSGIVSGLLPYVNKMDKLIVGLYDAVIGRKASGQSFAPGQAVSRSRAR